MLAKEHFRCAGHKAFTTPPFKETLSPTLSSCGSFDRVLVDITCVFEIHEQSQSSTPLNFNSTLQAYVVPRANPPRSHGSLIEIVVLAPSLENTADVRYGGSGVANALRTATVMVAFSYKCFESNAVTL